MPTIPPIVPLQQLRRRSLLIKARPTLLLLENLLGRISHLLLLPHMNRTLLSRRSLTRVITMAPETLMAPLPLPRRPLLLSPSLTEQESKKTGKSTNCVSFTYHVRTLPQSHVSVWFRALPGRYKPRWRQLLFMGSTTILGAGRSLLATG